MYTLNYRKDVSLIFLQSITYCYFTIKTFIYPSIHLSLPSSNHPFIHLFIPPFIHYSIVLCPPAIIQSSIHPYDHLSIIHSSIYLSITIHLFIIHSYIHLSIHSYIPPSTCPLFNSPSTIQPFIYPFLHIFINLSTYPSMHPLICANNPFKDF